MKLIKKVAGIDISKDSFTVCFGTLDDALNQKISKSYTFSNDTKGFKKLSKHLNHIDIFRSEDKDIQLWFVVEATGVYYEDLAYFLSESNYNISVILPNKIKAFTKTLENKSKTDSLDAAAITQFGLEKKLKQWIIPNQLSKELKELSRELLTNIETLTILKNRLHAKNHSHKPNPQTLKRLNSQIKYYRKQQKDIEKQIKELVESDKDLNNKIKNITTTKGIGFRTVVTVLAETDFFNLIENERQLTSYAGLDPKQRESGILKGKTPISKKGNKHLRNAVFMPALSAARFNETLKCVYVRLSILKNNKRIAQIAVARKILLLIFSLWKKDQEFITNYA